MHMYCIVLSDRPHRSWKRSAWKHTFLKPGLRVEKSENAALPFSFWWRIHILSETMTPSPRPSTSSLRLWPPTSHNNNNNGGGQHATSGINKKVSYNFIPSFLKQDQLWEHASEVKRRLSLCAECNWQIYYFHPEWAVGAVREQPSDEAFRVLEDRFDLSAQNKWWRSQIERRQRWPAVRVW